MGKKKRPPRIHLVRCSGCGSYRGPNGMVHRQVPAGVVWHCAACWAEIEEEARREDIAEARVLIARYRSRMGP